MENVNSVIAPTEKVKSLLAGYGINKDIYVVPTGIDLNRFNLNFGEDEKQKIKEQIGISGNYKVLITVGRLAKEKNIEEILFFVSKLKDKNIVLLIVGDGPNRKALENYVNKLGIREKILFTGMVLPEEVPKYYQLSDVFVSASNSETQGLTYIESLASGVPALCKRDPCLKGVIKDGINGWQYDSFEDFSQKLEYILDSERHVLLKENARRGAWSDFSSEAFAKKVEYVYKHAMGLNYEMAQ